MMCAPFLMFKDSGAEGRKCKPATAMLTSAQIVINSLNRAVRRNFIFLNSIDRQWEINIRLSLLPVEIFKAEVPARCRYLEGLEPPEAGDREIHYAWQFQAVTVEHYSLK